MRSEVTIASPWSCVTYTVVKWNWSCSRRISNRISSRRLASRFDSGSSSSSTRGSITMARASATRCCCPPDNSAGVALGQAAEPHRRQHLRHPRLHRLPPDAPQLQAKGDVFGNRHVRPDGVALEDHRHLPLLRRQRHLRRGDHFAVHADRPGGRPGEPGDHPQRRCLAAARRPQQRHELAGCDAQIQPLHRGVGTEHATDLVQRQARQAGFAAKPVPVHDRRSMKSRPTTR